MLVTIGLIKTETENMSRDDLIKLAGLVFSIFKFTRALSGGIPYHLYFTCFVKRRCREGLILIFIFSLLCDRLTDMLEDRTKDEIILGFKSQLEEETKKNKEISELAKKQAEMAKEQAECAALFSEICQ